MIETVEDFRARLPEFVQTETSAIEAALADAALQTDADVFGDLTDAAHMYLTAHLLAASPQGKEARIKGEGFQTLYLQERTRLEDRVGGILTAGW